MRPYPSGFSRGGEAHFSEQFIGRFEILATLGAGGTSEVYRARDPQLRREVAIKV
jgi:serine/threonine protein kinase